MKKLLIVFLSVSILAACNNKKATEKTDDKTATEKTDNKPPDDGKGGKDKDAVVTGWPEKDRNDFMTSCVDKAMENIHDSLKATRYCSCMLGKMEGEYPDVNKAATLSSEEINTLMMKYRDGCLEN